MFSKLKSSVVLFCIMFSFTLISHADMPKDLVLYLSFDEGNDKAVEDLSGNGNDAEVNGAKPVEGIHGMALEYSGMDTWIIVPDSPDLNFGPGESLTAMCWALIIGPPSGQGNLLAKYAVDAGTTPFYGIFHNANNQVHAYLRDTGGTLIDPWSLDVINDDEWHHIALVRDAENEKSYLYVDGNMDFEGDDPTQDLTNDVPLAIGRHTGEFLVGIVDEAMVFRRALSEDEIKTAMDPEIFLSVSKKNKLCCIWGEIKKYY
ncbi:hypothetical protein GF312_04445 [Candidatus Poribacteria bacterium]|nr:hypothetical protein [Candidatus Poribacteria bacterium]